MKVRAKMQVSEVALTGYSERVKMHAVFSDTGEDNTYAKATPSATLEMSIDNPVCHGAFRPGQKFYLDFSPAENQVASG